MFLEPMLPAGQQLMLSEHQHHRMAQVDWDVELNLIVITAFGALSEYLYRA